MTLSKIERFQTVLFFQNIRRFLLFALVAFNSISVFSQGLDVSSCPTMVKRSNGNGQASSAPGDFRPQSTQNNPVAPNVTGTSYQLVPYLPTTKTGDIHFKWTSNSALANIPVITRVWLTAEGSNSAVLSNIKFGPPSAAAPSAPNYYVDYSFYNNNMPNQGRLTLEFANPQTGAPAFTCTYDLRANGTSTQPIIDCTPTIITQPTSQVLCGASTATFSVSASGATGYQWQVSSDGITFSDISNGGVYSGATTAILSIASPNTNNGKFYRVVLSASGCPSATSSAASLIANPAPTAVFAGATNYCGTGSRSLGISLTGTAPFAVTYTVAGTPVTVNNITSSPYYIAVSPSVTTTVGITSVTDAYCTNNTPTGNTSVTINALPTITPTNAMACLGSSSFPLSFTNTGSANRYTITAGTRAMPGFVTVTNATLSASPVSVTIPNSGVAVGTYDFLISINSSVTGCVSAMFPFTVTVNNLPVVSASSGSNNVCAAASVNLLAAPANLATYSWSASPTATISAVYNPTVNPTATTVYTVTGTDANGCQATGNVTVTVQAGPTLSITPSAPTICNGNSTTLTAIGGSTYSWSPSTGLNTTSGATVIATPSTTTTYTVTSQNTTGCQSTGTVTVTVSTPSIAITNSSPTVCSGAASALTATAGFTTYAWYPTAGLYTDAGATVAYTGTSVATVYAKPLVTTTYSVVGTTAGGCMTSSNATVTLSAAPVNAATSTSNYYTFCSTGITPFPLTVNVSTAVSSMTWSYATAQAGPYTSFTSTASPTGATLAPSSTGSTNATLTVTPGNGSYGGPRFISLVIIGTSCTYNYDIQLFDTKGSGASLPSPIATQSTICSGSSTSLIIGTLNTALSVQWQSSSDNVTFANISGATATTYTTPALTATTYYKAVIGGSGSCGYTTGSVTITVGAAISGNTVTPATSCTNGSTFITLSGAAITGGLYQWQRSTTSSTTGFTDLVGATSQNYTLNRNVVPVITYYRRLASTSTCNANTSTAVAVYPPLTNNTVSTASTTTYCASAPAISITGSTPVGGDGTTYTYQWQSSTDNSSWSSASGTSTSQNYTTPIAPVTTYYRRQVTGGSCTTSNSDPLLITVNANPTVTVSPTSSSLCGGTPVTLTASGAASYSWSPSTELSTTTGASTTASITANRTYTVTGTNSFGCTATATSALTYTAPPTTPTVSSANVTVCSLPYNLTTLVTSGGTTEWYLAPVASATYLVSTPTAVNAAGTYYVFSKSGLCYSANYATVVLTLSDVTAPVLNSSSLVLCSPATANLAALQPTATSGTILEWHTGSTSGSPVVASPGAASSGTYYLFAYSTAGLCYGPASAAATVTINALPVATVSASPAAVCQPNTINLNTYNTTGNGTYSYQWYSVASSPTPATLISAPGAVATTGSYYLYATSTGGCKGAASSALSVTVNPLPTALLTAPTTVCAASTITLPSTTNVTSPVYTWQLSSNAGSSYSNISNGGVYSGATSGTLSISNSTGLDGTLYRFSVAGSTGCTTTSENVVVSVDGIASISTQPANYSTTANGSALFRINTTGSPTVNYQWKVSTNGGSSYSAITDGSVYQGTNTPDLVILVATAGFNNYKYQCDISNNCTSTLSSSAATLTVSTCTTASVGGTVSGSASVCTGTNSTPLTLSGHTGTVLYWEYSNNSFATEGVVVNNTTTSLTATNLTATTEYRAVIQSGSCATANSSSGTVTVSPASVGGSIAGAATVCTGTNSTTLTLSGYTGSIVKWQSSTNGFSTSTDIANTTTTLTATNLTATTQYRAVIQSGSCATANSSSATVTVSANGLWIGGATGDWNNAANWCGGVPTTPASVNIPSGSVVTITNADAYATQVNIAVGGSLVMNGTGNLVISAGGTFTNSGSFDASASTTGKVSFTGNGTISGTVTFKNIETYGAINPGTGTTITGEFTLQPGGSVTGNSPTYACPGSALVYRTTGIFVRSLEWTSATTGAGYPSNVYVQNNTTLNFPVVGPGYVCNDLIIDGGSALNQNYSGGSAPLTVARDVTITGTLSLGALEGGDINLGRNWTRNSGGVFTHNNRTVNFIGSYASAISAPILTLARDANGAFGGETFYKLGINKTNATDAVTLSSHISVLKELQLAKGSFDLANSDVTLVSKDEVTAAVSPIPTDGGAISGVTINYSGTGKFVVQRQLLMAGTSVSRRWRMLTVPLQSTGAPTINQAWQQGVSSPDRNAPIDPWPGFGTTITKSPTYNPADGYDQGITSNPSMYYSTNVGGVITWGVMPSLHVPITNYEGYMLFARGSRNIVVSTQFINTNSTILEPKGRINTGDISKTIKSGSQLIGNPYASAINFGNVSFTNYVSGSTNFTTTPASLAGAGITYYLWDPKTGGNLNVGKWIACSSNGNGTYAVTGNTSGLPTNGIIESSAAFMIAADTESGTLTFHETDKVATSSSIGLASRETETNNVIASLATNLLVVTNGNAAIADGVINSYHPAFRNVVDGQDAPTLSNFNTSDVLSIRSEGKNLAVERRNSIADSDTIFLQLQSVSKKSYQLQFKATNIEARVSAVLQDAYTGLSSPVSMTDTTTVAFVVNADVKSAAADRFKIVFKTAGVLPITFNNVKATAKSGGVAVQWKVANETNMAKYEVERSGNGEDFNKVNTTLASNNSQPYSIYNWLDEKYFEGDNYYRIKSYHINGEIAYSRVVKVVMGMLKPTIAVYPNPVQNQVIGLQFNNMKAGSFTIVVINNLGQVVDRQKLQYNGGTNLLQVQPMAYLSNGRYNVEIIDATGHSYGLNILVQNTK